MAWDFSTEPEFEEHLAWIREFRREQIEPLDLLHPHLAYHPVEDELRPLIESLKQQVKDRGLWAAHLGPELGGQGFGQLKLGLINEILGGSNWSPLIFGTAAPDTGNAEIIAHYGTPEQKAKYLQPLLDGECFSCFSMTEPHAGSDPKLFTTRAVRDGDEWVISGRKYYSSNARTSQFVIVMAVSNPEAGPYKGMSMFLIPSDTPGIEIERHIGIMGEPEGDGMHALIHYNNVRIPAGNLLGGEGMAFQIAQTRLGGGRVHHAMRSVGQCQRALDMLCERVLSRQTQGTLLADKQMVQSDIAESYAQLEMFRLLVLKTAWQIDQYQDYARVKKDISAIKFLMPKVLQDIVFRSMHVHGALGVSNEMPFDEMWKYAAVMAVVDGPTEVHKVTVAKEVLKGYSAAPGDWPTQFLPTRREWARKVIAERIEQLNGVSAS
jgi:acyl-CoA dehydrogenase